MMNLKHTNRRMNTLQNNKTMKSVKFSLLVILMLVAMGVVQAQQITILHTNDMHSRITGDGPELDYSPLVTHNDQVLGGFSRLATLLKQEKAKNPDGTLIVDAGDFLMGTLFNTLEPETGFQLAMMKAMGYQVVTIGNHEFDYGPNKLAGVISAAKTNGGIPKIVASNLRPDEGSPKDAALAALFNDHTLLPYYIMNVKGVSIGFIGILGVDAADVAPMKAPVRVEKQRKTARRLAKMLKKEKHVDLVVCLSHSGVYPDGKGWFYGEDVKLAKKAKYIDVIISGHTHVVTPEPIKVGNTLIVQTGSYLHNLGRLNLEVKDGHLVGYEFKLIPINDDIAGDPAMEAKIDAYKKRIEKRFLLKENLNWSKPLAETSFDMMKHNKRGYEHTSLGVFVADAVKNYVDRQGGGTDVELLASGTVRDNILKGKTGVITPPDVFRLMSLGWGNTDLPGYPLARIYITGHELKNLMEVLLLSHSDDGYVFVSGAKVYYHPKKIMLRRVYKIEINGRPIDLDKNNMHLYSITADTYLLSFIGRVKKLSKGLVNVIPKDRSGNPVRDMKKAIIDFDKQHDGVQGGAEWMGVVRYLQQLKDTDGDGIPDIPEKYKKEQSNRVAN